MKTVIINIITHFFEYIVQFAGNLLSDVLVLVLKNIAVSPTQIIGHLSAMNGREASAIIQTFSVMVLVISSVYGLLFNIYRETVGAAREGNVLKHLFDWGLAAIMIVVGKKMLCSSFDLLFDLQNSLFFVQNTASGSGLYQAIPEIGKLITEVLSGIVSPIIGSIMTLVYLYNILKVIIGFVIRQMELTFLLFTSPVFFSFYGNDETRNVTVSFLKALLSYAVISFISLWSLNFLVISYQAMNGIELIDVFYIMAMSFVIARIDILFNYLGLTNSTASKSIKGAISSAGNMITNLAGRTRSGRYIRSLIKPGSDANRTADQNAVNDLFSRNQISNRIPLFKPAEETRQEQEYRYENIRRNALGTSTSPIGKDHRIENTNVAGKISLARAAFNQMRGKGIDGAANTDLLGGKSIFNGLPHNALIQGKSDLKIRDTAINEYKKAISMVNEMKPGESIPSEQFSKALNLKNASKHFRLSEGTAVESLGEGRYIVKGETKNSEGKIETADYQICLNNTPLNLENAEYVSREYLEIGKNIHAFKRKE